MTDESQKQVEDALFATELEQHLKRCFLKVRDVIDVALQKRHFDDLTMSTILVMVSRHNLVSEERLFQELGYEWGYRYQRRFSELCVAFGNNDDFLSHLDRRRELYQAMVNSFD